MRRLSVLFVATLAANLACATADPAPAVPHSCDLPSAGQCVVFAATDSTATDREDCAAWGGAWDAPCAEVGRVGTCTCGGAGGLSTLTYYYAAIWTAEQAAPTCARFGCSWTVP